MPSITSWTRLEPVSRGKDIDTGLEARVHDPLWMLARQWQVGEFQAEDAGSPVMARLRAEVAKLTRYASGAGPLNPASARPYDGRLPLEALVEREPLPRAAGPKRNIRLAVEAGQYFLRLLAANNAAQYRDAFVAAFPIAPAAADADENTRGFLTVAAGRAPDGARLYEALRAARRPSGGGAPGLPAAPAIAPADQAAVAKAADAYLAWYEQLYSEPGAGEASPWISERMEYSFAVAAPTGEGERVLSAGEYTEGRLDWHSFDERPGVSLGAAPAQSPPADLVATVIPTPVTYRGMPATRWWEFEDAAVDFGSVESSPSDLVRLLLLNFVMEYSSDWFIMPVELETGSVCTAKSLVVTDTFGERALIRHYSEIDGPAGEWHLFRQSTAAGPVLSGPRPPKSRFFLAPALAAGIEGSAIEEVLLLRDEMANMAFGVERIVESAAGEPVNRLEQYQAKRAREREAAPPESSAADAPLRYQLATEVPEHWIPLVPVQTEDKRSVRLRRGRLLASQAGGTTLPAPLGMILEPGKPLSLFEEEVPRSGARITRAWQCARWTDGSTHVWIGRRKLPGRGEGSSGLRFDVVAAGKK